MPVAQQLGAQMSHFTRMQTTLSEGDLIAEALTDLGIAFERGAVRIRGFAGQKESAEFRIPTKSRGYDIGLVKVGSNYQVVADWWGVRGFDKATLQRQVTQAYVTAAAKAALSKQGFALVQREEDRDGTVRLVLRRAS